MLNGFSFTQNNQKNSSVLCTAVTATALWSLVKCIGGLV